MKNTLIAIFATALALGALGDDELVKLGEDIAMPKSMKATVGMEGISCVAIQVPHERRRKSMSRRRATPKRSPFSL